MGFKGGNLAGPMARAGSVSILVVCLAALPSSAGGPPPPSLLSGPYQVGDLGVLSLRVVKNEVKGTYASGSRCDFSTSDQLLEGTLEGSAFVGKLTTCLEGSGCGTTGVLPFFGVVSDTAITTYLTIPSGCSAPGLDDRRVVTIQIDYGWLKKNGEDAMRAGKWDAAIAFLRRAAQLPPGANDPSVLNLLGSAHNMSKAYAEGRQVFEAALELANKRGAPAELKANILYNLACSEAGVANRDPGLQARAIEHLKQALQLGSPNQFREDLAMDGDLDPLRGLPEFQKLPGAKKGPR